MNKYFNKQIIKKLFGTSNSLNINEINRQINLLNKIFSKGIKKDSPQIQIKKKEPGLIGENPMNVKKIFLSLQYYFNNCLNWRSTRTQFNITPPPLYPSITSQIMVDFFNPTLINSVGGGNMLKLEEDITKFISSLSGWDNNLSKGIFTFGGTGTNLYGMKIGINKSNPEFALKGIKNAIFIDNDQTHSCHRTACDWLGVGIKNDVILKTYNGAIKISEFEQKLEKAIKNNKKVGCIILNGGESYDYFVDPIYEIYKIRNKICKKYNLDYKPHIHVDSVSGWVFLFFNDYNFQKNPLNISRNALLKIKKINLRIKELKYADSFGVDFHKTGFTQYISSLFMLKNKGDLKYLMEGSKRGITPQSFGMSEYSPGQYTLETSRSAIGPVSAYVTLSSLGKKGYQYLVGNFMNLAEDLREKIYNDPLFIPCNNDSLGWCTLFLINPYPHKINFKDILQEKDRSKIEFLNNYQKNFYNFLNEKKNRNKWIFSLSSRYKIRSFKLYPMSPLIDIKTNDEILTWIRKNKLTFEKIFFKK